MAEEYAEECSRVACLQLAAMTGFETVNNSSLTVLSDMLQTHIKELCKLARSYTEGSGRTKVNAEDLVLGLGDMGIPFSRVREFRNAMSEDVPFAANVSKFPATPKAAKKPSFHETGEDPPAHIPTYLPIFPPKHTYIHTPVYPKHTEDPRAKALKAREAKKAAEDVLIRLGPGAAASGNPFVASVLDAGKSESTCPENDESNGLTGGTNTPTKSDEWTSLLLDKGDKKSKASIIPLPFSINPLGKLGTMPIEKKKRSRDAFEDREKGKKESKISNIDVSQFKFRIREGGLEGEASEGTAAEGVEAKDQVKETTSPNNPGSHEDRKYIPDSQDTPGQVSGKRSIQIGQTCQGEAKEIGARSSASQIKQVEPPSSPHGDNTLSGEDAHAQDLKDDELKRNDEDISFLTRRLNDEDSFQSDLGIEEGQNEEVEDGFRGQNDSQEYQFGLGIYEDTTAERTTAADEDDDKEPLVSGLFMDLDEGDKQDDKD